MDTIFPGKVNIPRKLPNIFWVSGLVGIGALTGMVFQARFAGELGLHHWQPTALRLAPLAVLTAAALALGLLRGSETTPTAVQKNLSALRGWNWAIFGLVFAVFPVLVFSPLGVRLEAYVPRFWLFAHLAILGALFCQAAWKKASYWPALAATLVIYGVAFQVVSYFPMVNSYPLTLGWSEASRYYYASLFFSRSIYGTAYPLPTLHPSRYLLQSIPYLIPSLPILAHRLWQVILWVVFTAATAALLAKRLNLKDKTTALLFTGWAYLFLMQGPVYYHLIVCAILVLWGFDRRHFWRSLLVVIAASAWAGISRVNWLPVPGLLASALYLLETPIEERPIWRYLLPPAVWTGVGLAAAYAVQMLYIPLSGAPAYEFGSSLSSPLLPYRLFPTATYSTGILLGILLAAGPMGVFILQRWLKSRESWHFLRVLGLAAILGVFFAGGIVVSIKIGGGSNLHNLDAFLVFLLVIGSYLFFDRFQPDRAGVSKALRPGWALLALGLALPLIPILQEGNPVSVPSQEGIRTDIASLQAMIDAVPPGSGEILFISGRELVTFHQVRVPSFEPEYENVFLMEMAMSSQADYLGKFERDLREHRFALIVTGPLNTEIQNSENDFAEENNAWVEHVSTPILNSYQKKQDLNHFLYPLQVLEPKP